MRVQHLGTATFLPLDTIKVKAISDKYRNFAKGARLAIDVITFDTSVERAMQMACGDALVCDDMRVARYVCYERGQNVKGEFHILVLPAIESFEISPFRFITSCHSRRNCHSQSWNDYWRCISFWKSSFRRSRDRRSSSARS